MSRMGAPPMTPEEIEQIKELLSRGIAAKDVAEIVGRSATSIHKIRKAAGFPPGHETGEKWESEKYRMLKKYWHWTVPKVEKRKSNFRTPYKQGGNT